MANLTSGLDDDIVDGGGCAALLRLCPSSRTIRFPAATRRGSICFLDQGLSPAASSPDYMTSSHDMAAKPATARISRSQEKWVLAATIIASGMAFIDMTIVNVALPVLQHSLNASFAQAQWVVEAYTLFLSALILTGGSIGDLYGRRRVFGIGIVLFALASATCGLAPDPLTLIMARATQGIGAALMMPGSLAILSASFPPERQGRAIVLWSAATGIGAAIAPALGGWLIDTFSWRWVFLINLPLAAISLAIVFARVPESRSARQRPLDWIGILLATCGLGGMTYGLIAAGQTGFAHPLTGGILAGGILFLILFVVA
ncbi:MAG TPA: MFS transporter, partial [Terriglobales bacterium]|nr:MFS transporter [Terriglobales bacterium]